MATRKKQPDINDSDEFSIAMTGVTPVRGNGTIDYEPEALPGGNLPTRPLPEDDEFVHALPTHDIPRNITSDQMLYHQGDIAPKVWAKIKKGELLPDATIDLHHHYLEDAAIAFDKAINLAYESGLRTLLIIHGKGSQKNPTPMIKNAIFFWLKLSSIVQGYCSAPSKLGGAGAVIVYVRRKRI